MILFTQVKSNLQQLEIEKTKLTEEISEKGESVITLQQELATMRQEMGELQDKTSVAVKESEEAKGRLAVLTEYFKEKEAHLTKSVYEIIIS